MKNITNCHLCDGLININNGFYICEACTHPDSSIYLCFFSYNCKSYNFYYFASSDLKYIISYDGKDTTISEIKFDKPLMKFNFKVEIDPITKENIDYLINKFLKLKILA